MKKILDELLNKNPVLIEQSDLPEFSEYCSTKHDLYAFRYRYFENNTVEITIQPETILRVKSKNEKAY